MGTAELAMMVLFPALGLLGLWVGYGIRKLSPAARVVAGILTGINLVLSIFGLPQSVIAITARDCPHLPGYRPIGQGIGIDQPVAWRATHSRLQRVLKSFDIAELLRGCGISLLEKVT